MAAVACTRAQVYNHERWKRHRGTDRFSRHVLGMLR
jgi:hypothetical protein